MFVPIIHLVLPYKHYDITSMYIDIAYVNSELIE